MYNFEIRIYEWKIKLPKIFSVYYEIYKGIKYFNKLL